VIDALVCLKPGELALEHRPTPQRGRRDALVRPRRVGICGTDYHIYEGKHPFLQYPRVMGHELAVEVLEAPSDAGYAVGEICIVNPYLSCGECNACRAGKPNCCVRISVLGVHQDGGMATALVLPAANLVKADGLAIDECATVEFLAIGAHAVRRSGAGVGQRALIIGAGPIGLGAALFASIANATVTIMDLDPSRLTAARSIIDVTTILAGEGAIEASSSFTGGEGFDVVFDATGNARSMEAGFDFVAHGGRYVMISVVKDRLSFSDPDFHRKEMTLLGSRNATAADFEHVATSIRLGRVPVDRLITHRTVLADAIRDIPAWATQKTGLIKAVVAIDG
jgi:2-desacetyl-2-hydroxyethyl bacteriochlorophyllide A dehydrogenase